MMATGAATFASFTRGSSGAEQGNPLIGKLEGPQVITDPTKFPRKFNEAPQLTQLVKAGKLPPVGQRIGQDPLVIQPVHEIGKYGGVWRRGFSGASDFWNGARSASGPDHILFLDYTAQKVVPNIARGWEFQDGGRALILRLRRGMKWSDGHDFTADDFMFWFEDVYQNKDLVPVPTAVLSVKGKQGVIKKVDQYTIRYEFSDPYYLLPDMLAGTTPISGQCLNSKDAMGGYAPAHYLKQFHPKYVSKEELDKGAKAAGMDNWVNLFKFKDSWHLNPELPVVSPWKTTTPANTPTWTLERNPYSIWVDTMGNQLPYIDKIVMRLAEDAEVHNLRAIAGEYDFQERGLQLIKLPVFLENQKKGGYKVYLDPGDNGGDMIIKINLDYNSDPEIGKWFNNTDFRRALSLGIDREQINEGLWLGTGTLSSVVPADSNKFNPGPQYRTLWSTYDPKKADEMLDRLGLNNKDAQGYRLRSDGKGRLSLEIQAWSGQSVPYTPACEMVREQWKKIGIDLVVQERDRSLATTKALANESQLYAQSMDGSDRLFTFPDNVFPYGNANPGQGPLMTLWFQTNGEKGKEPPPRMKEIMEKWRQAAGVPEEERVKLGKDIFRIIAEEVYTICVIGMGAANNGLRIAKTKLGNVPSRMYNGPDGKNPAISRTQTLYWKR